MNLVPIKVVIRRGPFGPHVRNSWPAFNDLPPAVRGGVDWAHFIDGMGIGWHYDRVAPFGQSDAESPDANEMFAITAVPRAFAEAAVAAFPTQVSSITELEFTELFDTRAHILDPDLLIDSDRLDQIRSRRGVTGPIDNADMTDWSDDERNATNPDHPAPGIVRNPIRLWTDYKTHRNVVLETL